MLFAALVSLWVFSASGAEIYKWVDEKGRTHYSQRDDAAGKTKAEQLKVSVPPPSASTPIANASRGAEQDQEKATKPLQAQQPEASRRAQTLRSDAVETDGAKCKLARAVLSGAVQHGNGAPTDAYDRQVAESDIRAFCSK